MFIILLVLFYVNLHFFQKSSEVFNYFDINNFHFSNSEWIFYTVTSLILLIVVSVLVEDSLFIFFVNLIYVFVILFSKTDNTLYVMFDIIAISVIYFLLLAITNFTKILVKKVFRKKIEYFYK